MGNHKSSLEKKKPRKYLKKKFLIMKRHSNREKIGGWVN